MKIVSISENRDKEKRIAITPEIAKKYGWKSKIDLKEAIELTYEDYLSKNYN